MAAVDERRFQESRAYWNQEAATFDNEVDHGLSDPTVYNAWKLLLSTVLPRSPARILDIGCGTGSLSVLLSRQGHKVTGVDLSTAMVVRAWDKARDANQPTDFCIMDASFPAFSRQQFDVVICRHILWALPDPARVLQRWVELLAVPGHLVLIEGFWHTGGGLHSNQVVDALPTLVRNGRVQNVQVKDLSNQPALWGGNVADERYLVSAELA